MENQLHFLVENGLCRSEKPLKTCVINFVSIPPFTNTTYIIHTVVFTVKTNLLKR